MATAKWLGTASLEIEHDGQVLLIDPHLSRLSKWLTFSRPIRPDTAKIDSYLQTVRGEIVGILVTHAHSDHVQDVPYIVERTGAPVWGNESVEATLKIHGLSGCAQVLAGGETFHIGPFAVESVKTRHGRVALGKAPFPGRTNPRLSAPLRVWHYRHGAPPLLAFVSIGGQTLFHQGTANLIDNLLPMREVDSAWVCASGHGYTPFFLDRLLYRIKPKRFIPFHFEDFSKPLTPTTSYIPGSDPFQFGEKARQIAPGMEIVVPQPYEPLPL